MADPATEASRRHASYRHGRRSVSRSDHVSPAVTRTRYRGIRRRDMKRCAADARRERKRQKRVGQTVGLQNDGRAIAQHVLGQLHLFPEADVTFQRLEVVSRVRRLGIDTCKQNADGQT